MTLLYFCAILFSFSTTIYTRCFSFIIIGSPMRIICILLREQIVWRNFGFFPRITSSSAHFASNVSKILRNLTYIDHSFDWVRNTINVNIELYLRRKSTLFAFKIYNLVEWSLFSKFLLFINNILEYNFGVPTQFLICGLNNQSTEKILSQIIIFSNNYTQNYLYQIRFRMYNTFYEFHLGPDLH